jgi:hypothetical protein
VPSRRRPRSPLVKRVASRHVGYLPRRVRVPGRTAPNANAELGNIGKDATTIFLTASDSRKARIRRTRSEPSMPLSDPDEPGFLSGAYDPAWPRPTPKESPGYPGIRSKPVRPRIATIPDDTAGYISTAAGWSSRNGRAPWPKRTSDT